MDGRAIAETIESPICGRVESIRVELAVVRLSIIIHYYPRCAALRATTKATVLSTPWKRNVSSSTSALTQPGSLPFLSTLVRDATRIARLLFRTTRAGLSSSSLGLSSNVSHRPACPALVSTVSLVDAAFKGPSLSTGHKIECFSKVICK